MNTNSVRFFMNEAPGQLPENCEIILAVWEIKNPSNMGKIIRLGHNIDAKKILFVNKEPNFRESKIKKTAGFSFEQANWKIVSPEEFFSLTEVESKVVALETCKGAENIFNAKLPKKLLLLAGGESHGLPEEIIAISNSVVFIPMPGGCKSMNVAQALSVAAFEWYRQQLV